MTQDSDSEAILHFKQYLRIASVHPDVHYDGCIEFLRAQASRLGLPLAVHTVAPGNPVAVLSWVGSAPLLPSLLLSSHMDVVPVYPDHWTHEPFGAEEDEHGNIFGRGAQDIKSVGIQYLEAVHRLKTGGFRPKRSIHICFNPDEEKGSFKGMDLFSGSEVFRALNVGCGLDEGVASEGDAFNLYYGERRAHFLQFIIPGTPGHGSLLLDHTAGEKAAVVMQRLMHRRAEEVRRLRDDPSLTIGDVTTINLTKVGGGVQANVVPPELTVSFDCRLDPGVDRGAFAAWLEGVCAEAGEGVRLNRHLDGYYERMRGAVTAIDDGNPWWAALSGQFDRMGLQVRPLVFPGGTDARFLRCLGIPAFGFSPMNNTPVRLHDHDEFLNAKVFLKGIKIYESIIAALSNV